MNTEENIKWEETKANRLRNYIAYYDNPENRKIEGIKEPYTLEYLNALSVMELLDLMPQNTCIEEYKENFGYHVTAAIVSFKIHKVIDGTWSLEYSEGHRDKLLKDQYVLFDFRCKNLKLGLIDMYLRMQTYHHEWWNGVRSGRIKLNLGDSWDELPVNESTTEA